MAETSRKLYGDLMSQPVRAIVIFCRITGIEIEFIPTFISKGQNRSEEFRKNVNPLGKLPVFQEGELILPESGAILSYLATTNRVPDHWYPADAQRRAKVDAAMHWHHGNIRKGAAPLLMQRVIGKRLGLKPEPVLADSAEETLLLALKGLEVYWIADRDFVAGDEISIADLLMVTELDQLHLLVGATEGQSREELLASFSKVRQWMQRVSRVTAPHHEEVSRVMMKAAANFARAKETTRPKL